MRSTVRLRLSNMLHTLWYLDTRRCRCGVSEVMNVCAKPSCVCFFYKFGQLIFCGAFYCAAMYNVVYRLPQ